MDRWRYWALPGECEAGNRPRSPGEVIDGLFEEFAQFYVNKGVGPQLEQQRAHLCQGSGGQVVQLGKPPVHACGISLPDAWQSLSNDVG